MKHLISEETPPDRWLLVTDVSGQTHTAKPNYKDKRFTDEWLVLYDGFDTEVLSRFVYWQTLEEATCSD